ncbi:MAG: 4a-hydroxytetrahydrobiopterin dehydratase [Candidatus Azotimanducaceae bacterium]
MARLFSEVGDALVADLQFADFNQAFRFMTLVAELAEAQQHHPEWRNVYDRVSVRLTTHDAGNRITDLDRNLAASIEAHPDIQCLGARVL